MRPRARSRASAAARGAATASAIAALGLWAAVAGAGDADDPLLVELGGFTFERHCAACHGVDARGSGPVADALDPRPADLTRIAARRGGRFPAAEITRFIDGRRDVAAHGNRAMPVWGRRFGQGVPDEDIAEALVRGQLRMLVAYLQSIQEDAYLDGRPSE